MQELPDFKTTDSKEETSCRERTKYSSRRKVSVNCDNDTKKLNIVVYCYQHKKYVKDNASGLNLTDYQLFLAKRT